MTRRRTRTNPGRVIELWGPAIVVGLGLLWYIQKQREALVAAIPEWMTPLLNHPGS